MENMIKKNFSKIGFSFLSLGIVAIIVQIIVAIIISSTNPQILSDVNLVTIISSFCQYVVPIPVFYLLVTTVEKVNIEKHRLSIKTFLICICITFTLMYIGNIVGLGITEIISIFKQNEVINPIMDLITSSNIWLNLVLISFIAPIFEEFFFRKMLIDRTIKYGAKISVILSALMFGLFHGNLNQFFYAFLLGGFFAIVYVKTGNLIYTILLHIITNFSGSVVSIGMQSIIDGFANTMTGDIISLAYFLVILALCLIGLIFIVKWRKQFSELKDKIENPLKSSLLNIGMVCFILYCLFEIVQSLIV